MLVQAGAAKNGVRPWVCSWPRVVQQQAQTLQLAARRRSCRSVSSSSALYRFKCWEIVRPKLLEGVRSFDDFFLWRSLASTPTGAKKLLVEKNPDGEVEACMPSCCYAKNVMEIVNAKVSFFYIPGEACFPIQWNFDTWNNWCGLNLLRNDTAEHAVYPRGECHKCWFIMGCEMMEKV